MPNTASTSGLENDRQFFRYVLQQIATGPNLSRDLSTADAYRAMRLLLQGQMDPVQSGVFLIALRMKRETEDEMCGALQAISEGLLQHQIQLDNLLTLSDPYAGYDRCLPASPFVPAVLAACGQPALLHGALSMGPKYGVTPARVLAAAGVDTWNSVQTAGERLIDPSVGWAYLDHNAFVPEVAALQTLRDLIVKRPCLTTLERLLMPVQASGQNHLVSGYVHKAYPPVYSRLARLAGFDSVAVVRGVEGGFVPSVAQPSKLYASVNVQSSEPRQSRGDCGLQSAARTHTDDTQPSVRGGVSKVAGKPESAQLQNELREVVINPSELGIQQTERALAWPVDVPESNESDYRARALDETEGRIDHTLLDLRAEQTAAAGLQALSGEDSLMRDAIRLSAAVALASCPAPTGAHLASPEMDSQRFISVLEKVDAVLNSGAALRTFRAESNGAV